MPENLEFSTATVKEKVFNLVQRMDFKIKSLLNQDEKLMKSVWEIFETFFHNLGSIPKNMQIFLKALMQEGKRKVENINF